jgi:hypothetical protein
VSLEGKDKWGALVWSFKCDCGTNKSIVASRVIGGFVSHCGCETPQKGTHRLSRTKEYNTWCRIIVRCYNENSPGYSDYGGRGIFMSDSWRNSFETFFADMGEAPSNKHSIDRIENDKGYYKENCRWATSKEQARNRRSNNVVEINGVKKCVLEWCEHYGVSWHTFKTRRRRGVSMDMIFSKSLKRKTA